jgi:probable HAF family extracellular repeat protein
MGNDGRSLVPDRATQLERVGKSSRQITRGIDRLRSSEPRFIELAIQPGGRSEAWAINSHGQVVGSVQWSVVGFEWSEDNTRAVLWEHGQMALLETRVGWLSRAHDINDQGQVVGVEHRGVNWQEDWDGVHRGYLVNPQAILWDNGRRMELAGIESGSSQAYAINNLGQIVGTAEDPVSDGDWGRDHHGKSAYKVDLGAFRAVLWQGGERIALEILPLGMDELPPWEKAYGINDLGQIVGASSSRPVEWEGNQVTEINLSGSGFHAYEGESKDRGSAYDINNLGTIVGIVGPEMFYEWAGPPRSVLWKRGLLTDIGATIDFYEPASVEGLTSNLKINNRGQVVGLQPVSANPNRAYLWEDGRTIELGTPTSGASYALGLNDLGHVVGSYEGPDGTFRACMWG